MAPLYEGRQNIARRQLAEEGRMEGFRPYRKTALAYARREPDDFVVSTLEGVMAGKAGDYLAIGPHGEMYPIDADVFADSYEEAD